jgi:hypothetical protein
MLGQSWFQHTIRSQSFPLRYCFFFRCVSNERDRNSSSTLSFCPFSMASQSGNRYCAPVTVKPSSLATIPNRIATPASFTGSKGRSPRSKSIRGSEILDARDTLPALGMRSFCTSPARRAEVSTSSLCPRRGQRFAVLPQQEEEQSTRQSPCCGLLGFFEAVAQTGVRPAGSRAFRHGAELHRRLS